MTTPQSISDLPFDRAVELAMERYGLSREEAEGTIRFGRGDIQGCLPDHSTL